MTRTEIKKGDRAYHSLSESIFTVERRSKSKSTGEMFLLADGKSYPLGECQLIPKPKLILIEPDDNTPSYIATLLTMVEKMIKGDYYEPIDLEPEHKRALWDALTEEQREWLKVKIKGAA